MGEKREYAVFLNEAVVAMNKYVVEAESKEEAIRLTKEGKARGPELIELVQKSPESQEFMGFDYAVADIEYGDLDYPPIELFEGGGWEEEE